MEEAVPMLSAIFERDDLLNRNVNAERTVVETYERRLTRLGYDVHDGPLQDLALLGEDVRLFRRQLAEVLPADVARLAMGRLDDLDAQLAALDSDLRVISASLQSPFTAHRTVTEALEFLIGAFAARTKVKPRLKLEGDLDDLTHSQEMAILSIVREALNNVREHSNASRVAVTVTGGPGTIDFRIVDDGVGFDVEATLIRAAREGRFGLVGLHERARLLGGQSRIDSRRGGPTTISVTLPRWRPVAGDAETRPGRST
jgi:signal transduction histidine kinase